jgi:hypothetical protein
VAAIPDCTGVPFSVQLLRDWRKHRGGGAKVGLFARKIFVVVLVSVGIQGCAFRFLESYDADIETGISDYQKSTIDYLTRITQNPAAPENSYTSTASQAYYASSAAQLSELVVRAATDPGPTCVPGQLSFLESYVQQAVAGASAKSKTNSVADVDLSSGTCTAVAIRVMQADHNRMEAMHKRDQKLGAANASLWISLVEDSTRMALTIVKATKP